MYHKTSPHWLPITSVSWKLENYSNHLAGMEVFTVRNILLALSMPMPSILILLIPHCVFLMYKCLSFVLHWSLKNICLYIFIWFVNYYCLVCKGVETFLKEHTQRSVKIFYDFETTVLSLLRRHFSLWKSIQNVLN